jgi:hypothetical protein
VPGIGPADRSASWKPFGMSSLAIEPHAIDAISVDVNDDSIIVNLSDGRTISAPIEWFPRLMRANKEERGKWEIIGSGEGIHWSAIDEDISVGALMRGVPSQESQKSLQKWLESRQNMVKTR